MKNFSIILALVGGLLLAASAQAQTIIYQDNFAAGTQNYGILNGTAPDTVDTGGATWSVGPGFDANYPNTYGYYAGTVSQDPGSYGFTSAQLPVTSTTNLAGGFTLSAIMTPGTGTDGSRADVVIYSGSGGINANQTVSFQLAPSGYAAYGSNTPNNYLGGYPAGVGPFTTPTLFGVTYNPTALTLSFSVGGTLSSTGLISGDTVLFTQSVTAANIAAMSGVGFGFSNYAGGNTTATAEQFTLSVVPEPSTWALMMGGVLALAMVSRRRTLRA
jgi:hypothetical protein